MLSSILIEVRVEILLRGTTLIVVVREIRVVPPIWVVCITVRVVLRFERIVGCIKHVYLFLLLLQIVDKLTFSHVVRWVATICALDSGG